MEVLEQHLKLGLSRSVVFKYTFAHCTVSSSLKRPLFSLAGDSEAIVSHAFSRAQSLPKNGVSIELE